MPTAGLVGAPSTHSSAPNCPVLETVTCALTEPGCGSGGGNALRSNVVLDPSAATRLLHKSTSVNFGMAPTSVVPCFTNAAFPDGANATPDSCSTSDSYVLTSALWPPLT